MQTTALTRDDVQKQVLERLAHVIREDIADIPLTADLDNALGVTSMDKLELAMHIEKDFGIKVPDTEHREFLTVEVTVNYVMAKLQAKA